MQLFNIRCVSKASTNLVPTLGMHERTMADADKGGGGSEVSYPSLLSKTWNHHLANKLSFILWRRSSSQDHLHKIIFTRQCCYSPWPALCTFTEDGDWWSIDKAGWPWKLLYHPLRVFFHHMKWQTSWVVNDHLSWRVPRTFRGDGVWWRLGKAGWLWKYCITCSDDI